MKKRSVLLLIATLIATVYCIYIVIYFMGGVDETAGAIAGLIVAPHMICVALGVLFGWIGYLSRLSGFALASAIMYCVAALLFVMYAFFLVPSIVLGFVGYGRQKKLNNN